MIMSKIKRYKKGLQTWPDNLNFINSNAYLNNDEPTGVVHVELPYPIHQPFSHGRDIVKEILEEKAKYARLESYARKEASSSKRYLNRRANTTLLSRNILNVYATDDPDPFFNCDYNFYYTGGTLEHVNFKGIDYLIRPNSDNELCVTALGHDEQFKIDFEANSPILGLKVLYCDTGLSFTVREKHKVSLLYGTDFSSGEVETRWLKESKTIPISDAKLNPMNKQNIALTTANFLLRVYDLETNKVIRKHQKPCVNNIDNFSQIVFLDENVMMYANRSKILIFDLRDPKPKDLKIDLEDCNSVCSLKAHNNSIFVATRHDLCKYDLRSFDPTEHCSHMLSAPPCYVDILENYQDTFIVLSGQMTDQKVLFGSKSSNKLPINVPSLLDTYKEARLRKDLLLKGNLEKFLTYSVTGVKILGEINSSVLYSADSVGQLYKQNISNQVMDIQQPIELLHNWINKLPKPENELHATGIVEMSKVRFKLLRQPKSCEDISYSQNNKCNKFLRRFGNKYKEENFCGMAAELMSIWNVDNNYGKPEVSDEAKAHRKVTDWIASQAFNEDDGSLFNHCF